MSEVEDFLSPEAEDDIIAAIREAEKDTSGEIRVHIENEHDPNTFMRAQQVFHILKMDNTLLRNGVLIYIAVDTRKFAIVGDKGINDHLKFEFWKATKDHMEDLFRHGYFKVGIIQCIQTIGREMSKHYPWSPFDNNELTDQISKKEE